MGKFILGDLSRDLVTGKPKNKLLSKRTFDWLGHALFAPPFEGYQKIDFTGSPGSTMGIYYSLTFQLGKWEFQVQKADEWVEVSPAHAQYYQITQKQKEELEEKIKRSLQSISQAVADMELLMHDMRKYEEYLHYLGYRTKKEHHEMEKKKPPHPLPLDFDEIDFSVDEDEKKSKEREKRIDNHALKAIFIDNVDAHTGDNVAMRSIVSRWPTLISDFIAVDDEDMDPDKVKDKLGVTKAEAIVIITKNKLYVEWKRMFLPEIKARYKRILQLVNARKKSVESYREWARPYIARHKLLEEGFSRPKISEQFKTLFITPVGQAYSSTKIEIWAWKDFQSPEIHKVGTEDISRKPVPLDDDWTMRNLIFDEKEGLIADYPWITVDWVKEKKKEMVDSGWFNLRKIYYSFFIIDLEKTNLRMPTGDELENGMFGINLITMSQNVLFAKLLELKAKQEEFENYISSMLGVPKYVRGERYGRKYRDRLGPIKNFLDYFSANFQFFKRGPYERDFDERVAKFYQLPIASGRLAPMLAFVHEKIGMGTS